jgi:hypothetical protein
MTNLEVFWLAETACHRKCKRSQLLLLRPRDGLPERDNAVAVGCTVVFANSRHGGVMSALIK